MTMGDDFGHQHDEQPTRSRIIDEVLHAADPARPPEPRPNPSKPVVPPDPEPEPLREFTPPPEILTASALLTADGEVVMVAEPDPETLIDQLSPVAALLVYFGAYGPWAAGFAALLVVTEAHFSLSWYVTFGAAWLTCFLASGFALYAQAISGFAQPRANPWAGRLALIVGALSFGLTTWVMREQGLYNAPAWILANNVALLALTSAIGFAIAREIQQSGHLIAVALVGLVVDLWSVFQGPSKQIAETVVDAVAKGVYTGEVAPPWLSFLLLRYPVPGVSEIQAMLGAGDLVFLAFFFGCVARFRLPAMINYIGLTLGLVGSLILVNVLHEYYNIPAIPALPILAPLFIVLNVRHLRMNPREWRITGVFVAVLLGIMLTLTAIQFIQQLS